MWFFSIPFGMAVITLILLIVGLYKYISNAFDKEMLRREAAEEERVLLVEAAESLDTYWEQYDPSDYWPHLTNESDSMHLIEDDSEATVIVDLGNGNGIGPDGEIYKIVSSDKHAENKNLNS